MAKPTSHSALADAGFKLAEENSREGGRVGTVTTRRYTKNTGVIGEGTPVRPITHHVTVQEYGNSPGKPDVHYEVTQQGGSYADGYYDTLRRHKKNGPGGVEDPIAEILSHHGRVAQDLTRRGGPSIEEVGPHNLSRIIPDHAYHWSPGWAVGDDPHMKRTVFLRPGGDPDIPLHTHSATQDRPLDPHVHRRLTGGAKGRPSFEYMGRIAPGDLDTDVYHAAYQDPEDPYMRYGFTVRHMPGATSSPVKDHRGKRDPLLPKPLVFSYNVTHYPTDILDEGGDYPIGEFMDVTGEKSPAANFTDVGPLIERHHNMLRSVGLMDLPPRDPRPAWHFTASLVRRCPECGNDDVDFIQGYDTDERGIASIPTNRVHGQCNNCFHEFQPKEALSPDAAEWSPSMERESSTRKRADKFDDIISGAGSAGPCWSCGKATYNRSEGRSLQSDSSAPVNAHEETGGDMHGPDINLCGDCYTDPENYHMAVTHGSRGPGKIWHWNDQGVRGCPECEGHLMDQADEDLRP